MKATWPTKKLREICEEIISGDWGTEREKTGSVLCKVIRGTDFILVQKGKLSELPDRYIDIEKFEKIKLKPGDILVEISGGSKDQPTGRILFWDRNEIIPIAFSNFVKKILLNTEIVEPKFFFRYWQFLYFKGITKNYEDRTTNIRNFKLKEFLENEEIPLPPLLIQQKIVKILDTIQEAIDIQEKIIEKVKELKKSLMAELFKYGAPSFRRGRKLKKTEIGEIPEDWEVVRLGDKRLFEIKLGGTPKTSVSEYWNGEIPWITPNDLSELTTPYIEDTQRKISLSGLKAGSTLLPENSIILSTRAPIGYIALLRKPMAFNQGCKGIVIKEKSVVSLFLYYFLLSKAKLLQELGTGSTFKELATSDLENFKIPLPSLPEQQEIAEILQTIDQKIEIEKRKKELYEELFKTMLNKIMNQEIDVEKIEV
jgi:type I restriction enzyme S subunit